jgi:glycosyltransferase involved in cell wall biosynthesis
LRILFLNPSGFLGGAERALLEMIASLRERYPRCRTSVVLGDRGLLEDKLRALDASIFLVPLPKPLAQIGDAAAGGPAGDSASRWGVILRLAVSAPAIASYLRRLRVVLSDAAPDVIHSNGLKMHLLATRAAPQCIPVIWHIHDFLSLRPLAPRLLMRTLPRCAAIIANSRSVARDLTATLGAVPPVHTVYQAVDLNSFRSEGNSLDLDRLAGMKAPADGVLRVGLLGTMARWKGHEVFLRAVSMLPPNGIRAYIIGDSIYRTAGSQYTTDELRLKASALGLEGRVGFTGFIKDPADALRALDIVVHASIVPEPFGLAVAEAFACGRAVVVSRGGGIDEIARENQNALAHSPGDARELAAALARLGADANFRRSLGRAARRTAESLFARPRLAHDLMRIYESVASVRAIPALAVAGLAR